MSVPADASGQRVDLGRERGRNHDRLVLFDPVVAVKLHTKSQGVVRTSQDFRAVSEVFVYVVMSMRDLSLFSFW